jgi:hypothetical protein
MNYWIPAYGLQTVVVLLGLLAVLAALHLRSRRRRRVA